MTVFIDPGRSTGVAIFEGPVPIVAKLTDATAQDALDLFTWVKARGHERVVIEDQHAPRDPKRLSWPRLMTLVLGAHRWVVAAELLGMQIERPKASEWQGPMHASTPTHDEAGKKLTTKQRSKIVVARTYGQVNRLQWHLPGEHTAEPVAAESLPHDICDAICMGRWWQLYRTN